MCFFMITLIAPQGYCMGVKRAIKLLDEVLAGNYPQPIYLLGKLIHNDIVMKQYHDKGVIILDESEKEKSLLEINKGTIVFQAHGTDPKLFTIAKEKGLTVVDATCPFVTLIHNRINAHIKEGYDIIYIGKSKHSESEASLSLASNINFVTCLKDVANLNIANDKIYVTNQTTLSTLDLADIFTAITMKYPQAIIDNKICQATQVRQEAVLNAQYDLIIVVGDNHSSNTKRLYELASSKTKAIYANSLSDILSFNFSNYHNIGITSGASTPEFLVKQIYDYLQKLVK